MPVFGFGSSNMRTGRVIGGAVGVFFVPAGMLIFWGGLTGNLAAILAALFARDQLVSVAGASSDNPPGIKVPGAPPFIPPVVANPPTPGASPEPVPETVPPEAAVPQPRTVPSEEPVPIWKRIWDFGSGGGGEGDIPPIDVVPAF